MLKKIFSCMILSVFILFIPTGAAVAKQGSKPKMPATELKTITDNLLSFIYDEPTAGKEISMQELESILRPYRAKYSAIIKGGNTTYYKAAAGDFIKQDGRWQLGREVTLLTVWSKSATNSSYIEELTLAKKNDASHVGVTEMMMMRQDDKFVYLYEWLKYAKTGEMMKIPKAMIQGQLSSMMPNIDADKQEQDYSRRKGRAVLYPDQTLNGQICKVFKVDNNHYWLSTVTGLELMNAEYDHKNKAKPSIKKAQFIYDLSSINKDNSFFMPPADVKFEEGSF